MFTTNISKEQYDAIMLRLHNITLLLERQKPMEGRQRGQEKYKLRTERKNTICYHVRQLLADGKPHTWRELRTQVAKLMGKNIPKQSVNAYLSKLYRLGQLNRVGHGIYQKKMGG